LGCRFQRPLHFYTSLYSFPKSSGYKSLDKSLKLIDLLLSQFTLLFNLHFYKNIRVGPQLVDHYILVMVEFIYDK
ncbi:MAG: hypothetical protein ACI9PD_001662, partial [Psychrobacter glaciei]